MSGITVTVVINITLISCQVEPSISTF